MSAELAVTITGIAITTALTIWSYLRSNPKRILRYRAEVSDLLNDGRFNVPFNGSLVTDAHLLTLTIWSNGRADISSHAFDGLRPLVFQLNAPIIGTVPARSPQNPQLEVMSQTELKLMPTLLRKGFQSRIQVIVDGFPRVDIGQYPLIDIPIVAENASDKGRAMKTSRKRLQVTTLSAGLAALALSLVLLSVGLTINVFDADTGRAWGIPALMVGFAAVPTVLVGGVIRIVRWRSSSSAQPRTSSATLRRVEG